MLKSKDMNLEIACHLAQANVCQSSPFNRSEKQKTWPQIQWVFGEALFSTSRQLRTFFMITLKPTTVSFGFDQHLSIIFISIFTVFWPPTFHKTFCRFLSVGLRWDAVNPRFYSVMMKSPDWATVEIFGYLESWMLPGLPLLRAGWGLKGWQNGGT